MLNRWSLYQALACRMWARSALYQSSGAYGFRDQLQDVMAFVVRRAGARARAHPARRGAAVRRGRRAALVAPAERARRAHPLLRRPRLAAVRRRPLRARHRRRVGARRDASVPHDAAARAARARGVRSAGSASDQHGSVYEHCLRALRRACTTGRPRPAAHRHRRLERRHEPRRRRGPGRERVARLVPHRDAARLRRPRGRARGDAAVAAELRAQADAYAAAVEAHGWDGEWYRRAYFDDGTPLGSADERRVPHRLDRAELERDLGRGRRPSGRRRRCARSSSTWCARTRGSSCCSRRRSTRRRTTRATSRATCRACARTARSTPTPRSGPCWPRRCAATAIARSSCSR